MKKMCLVLFCLGLSFVMYAQRYLTEAESGNVIQVATSEKESKLIVNLKYSGGTAYTWKLVSNDPEVLALVNESTSSNSSGKDVNGIPTTGGSRTASFEFKITGNSGTSELTFVLSPAYDANQIAKTATYTIQVGDGNEYPVQEPIILTEKNQNVSLALSTKDAGTPIVVCLANFDGDDYKWVNVANNGNIIAYQSEEDHYDKEDPNYPFIRDFDFFVTGEIGTSNMKFNLQSSSGKVLRTTEYTISVK